MEKITVDCFTFVAIPATCFGDYGGEGAVARANLDCLIRQFDGRTMFTRFSAIRNGEYVGHVDVYRRNMILNAGIDLVILQGDYSSEQAYLREGCVEFDDIMSALSDYPCLDEEEVARVELEWQEAAVPDTVRDMGRTMREFGELYEEIWDALDQEQAESVIRDALSRGTGAEVHYELSGAYIDADAVAKLIADSWRGMEEHRAVKLPDGTLVSLGMVEDDEEPEENGRIDSLFAGLPSDPVEYVREFSRRLNHRGAHNMEKVKLTTTLNRIREHSPCSNGWRKLLSHLGKTAADDEPINLLTILDSNGVQDMLWCLQATVESSADVSRRLAIAFAENVLHIFEHCFPNEDRPRNTIEAAKNLLGDAAAYAYAAYADAAYAAAAYAYAYAYAAYADAAYADAAYADTDADAYQGEIVRGILCT